MARNTSIPIKNIYYMLGYAWDQCGLDAERACGSERFGNIYDLMARLLIHSARVLIRRGFHREYVTREDALATPRGRIDVHASVSRVTIARRELICAFDEFTEDAPFNRIIKATMRALAGYGTLDATLRDELTSLLGSLAAISDVALTARMFSALAFNANNRHYMLILNICLFVFEGRIAREEPGSDAFSDFALDGRLAKIYECFVRNFYRRHLSRAAFHVHAPRFPWNVDEGCGVGHLPAMQTDIAIENRSTGTQLIIDTKFYQHIFTESQYGTRRTFWSSNLYQIYAYVNNSPYSGRVKGMLLYPTIDEEINEAYAIAGKSIMIRTLDLNREWGDIERRLFEIAEAASD